MEQRLHMTAQNSPNPQLYSIACKVQACWTTSLCFVSAASSFSVKFQTLHVVMSKLGTWPGKDRSKAGLVRREIKMSIRNSQPATCSYNFLMITQTHGICHHDSGRINLAALDLYHQKKLQHIAQSKATQKLYISTWSEETLRVIQLTLHQKRQSCTVQSKLN